MQEKRIFTFWEPKDKIPGYLKLCMKTCEKFLPDYEICVLDYSSLDKWLGKDYYDKYLYKNFSLPKQADAIRAVLLNKYGGLWMDTDDMITSSKKIRSILAIDSEMVQFATSNTLSSALKKLLDL